MTMFLNSKIVYLTILLQVYGLVVHAFNADCDLEIDLSTDRTYELNIDEKRNCWFQFLTNNDYGLKVEFEKFKFPNSVCTISANNKTSTITNQKCCGDHLAIGSGNLIDQNLHAVYCGWSRKESVILNSNKLWLTYTNGNDEIIGEATIRIKPVKLVFRNESYGLITSESNYFNDMSLLYKIIADEDHLIYFNFLNRFSTEKLNQKCMDYLEIGELLDEENDQQRKLIEPKTFCGNIAQPGQLTLTTNSAYVKVFTDENELNSLFELEFMPIKYIFKEPVGIIESPQRPINITYKIIAPEGKKIELIIGNYNFLPCQANEQLADFNIHKTCKSNHHLVVSKQPNNLIIKVYH